MGRSRREKKKNLPKMSEWVVLDISSMTKSTKTERILKILKDAKIDVVKITDIYPSEQRNKNVISMTVRRSHYEDEIKSPDWPGSWIFEVDYTQKEPEGGPLL